MVGLDANEPCFSVLFFLRGLKIDGRAILGCYVVTTGSAGGRKSEC